MAGHALTKQPLPRTSGLEEASLRTEAISDEKFHFISVQGPHDAEDPRIRRMARSHAVREGLQRKRQLQQTLGHNLRVTVLDHAQADLALSSSRRPSRGDAHLRTIESPRVQVLLHWRKYAGVIKPRLMMNSRAPAPRSTLQRDR